MIGFFLKGGLLMWPILLCSIVSAAVILERFYYLYQARTKVSNIFSRVKGFLQNGKAEEALKLCENTSGSIAHILAIGIHLRNRSIEEKEKIMARAGSREICRLEKNLRGLVIIGNIAPLIGLLGTVIGMIRAFIKIQEFGGIVDATVLAGGIWEALITTAAGLSVAIPTVVFYHYLEGRVDDIAIQLKDATSGIIEIKHTSDAGRNENEDYGI